MSFSSKSEVGYLSFAGGLVTEYNPLSPPEGVTADELNMDLDTEGMVRVIRPPLKEQFQLQAGDTDLTVPGFGVIDILSVASWEDIKKYLVVSQRQSVTGTLEFVIVVANGTSSGLTAEAAFPVGSLSPNVVLPTVTFVRKRAVVTLAGNVLILQQEASGKYSMFNINLLVRDFKLVADDLRISQRPTTLTDPHKYNLLNAGWFQNRRLKSSGSVGDPIPDFNTVRSQYPSNADVSYLGDATNTDGELVFDPSTYDNIDTGSTEAPRGHYIFNIRNINRSSKLTDKLNDGSSLPSVVIIGDGNDPETGEPPVPTNPWFPDNSGLCIPGEPCEQIP